MTRETRQQLAGFFVEHGPFKFESLVKFLLEEMGYRISDSRHTVKYLDFGAEKLAQFEVQEAETPEI